MSTTTKIEIINLKKIENAGSLKALADFKLNQSEFYSWRVIQQDGQSAWVSPPQESWESGGKKHYKPLVKLPKELMSLISDAILRNYEEVGK
jgi:DNA-binding cell septation regulator SpoVG